MQLPARTPLYTPSRLRWVETTTRSPQLHPWYYAFFIINHGQSRSELVAPVGMLRRSTTARLDPEAG